MVSSLALGSLFIDAAFAIQNVMCEQQGKNGALQQKGSHTLPGQNYCCWRKFYRELCHTGRKSSLPLWPLQLGEEKQSPKGLAFLSLSKRLLAHGQAAWASCTAASAAFPDRQVDFQLWHSSFLVHRTAGSFSSFQQRLLACGVQNGFCRQNRLSVKQGLE